SENDVVRIDLGERVTHLVQGRREPRLAEDERRPTRTLGFEQAGGRQGGGPDRRLGDVEAAPTEARWKVTRRVHRVGREDEERGAACSKPSEELIGAGYRLLFPHEDAVHVHQP